MGCGSGKTAKKYAEPMLAAGSPTYPESTNQPAAKDEPLAASNEPTAAGKSDAKVELSAKEDAIDLTLDGEEDDFEAAIRWLELLNTKQLRSIFETADLDHSGFLDLKELKSLIFPGSDKAAAADNLSVAKMFAQMDRNCDGKIGCGELVSYFITRKQKLLEVSGADRRQIAVAFSAADADQNGSLSLAELEHLFGSETPEEKLLINATFALLDTNGDGHLSVLEFSKLYGAELLREARSIEVQGSMDAGDDEEAMSLT